MVQSRSGCHPAIRPIRIIQSQTEALSAKWLIPGISQSNTGFDQPALIQVRTDWSSSGRDTIFFQ